MGQLRADRRPCPARKQDPPDLERPARRKPVPVSDADATGRSVRLTGQGADRVTDELGGDDQAQDAGPLAQPLPAPLRYQHLLEGIEVLDTFARAEHD